MSSARTIDLQKNCPIAHVLVVGFHHKRGAIVEFAYPPFAHEEHVKLGKNESGQSAKCGECVLPDDWRHLPSLALPDGAHHSEKDTVYFVMPSLSDQHNRAVFGISCYRQIASQDLLQKNSDVTRSTVQKAVCVISNVPAYAQIRTKLDLITQAYFNERDFSKVEVLSEMYKSLCAVFPSTEALLQEATFDMLEWGLYEGASYKPGIVPTETTALLQEEKSSAGLSADDVLLHEVDAALTPKKEKSGIEVGTEPSTDSSLQKPGKLQKLTLSESCSDEKVSDNSQPSASGYAVYNKMSSFGSKVKQLWSPLQPPQTSSAHFYDTEATEIAQDAGHVSQLSNPGTKSYSTLKTDAWGFPLSVFVKGNLCHPYASISLMDDLKSPNTRAYLIGATNALYKQRAELFDVIVQFSDTGEPELVILDPDLRRQLSLTTADLRFVDYLMKNVGEMDTGDVFLDNTSWEGGDEWLRLQFRSYLLSLMASASHNPQSKAELDSKNPDKSSQPSLQNLGNSANPYIEDFNEQFVDAWKQRHNFRVWNTGHYPDLCNAIVGSVFDLGANNVVDVI